MTDYNPTEAQRLIAALREDDARMTSGTWTVDEWGALGIRVDGKSAGISSMGSRPDAAAIARTRNNLRALADQLEAAGREVERLTGERDRVVAHGHEVIAERDSLRAEVEQYNPTEAQRLIAEAREQYRHEDKHGVHVRAGTLLSLADQLEAAGRRVDALGASLPEYTKSITAELLAVRAERDSLRAEVDRWRIQRDEALAVRDAFKNERDSLRACIESEIHAHAASCARELAAIRERDSWIKRFHEVADERDSLRQQLEATQEKNTGWSNTVVAVRLALGTRDTETTVQAAERMRQQLEAAQRELRASTAGSTAAREDDERVAQHVEQLENDELSAQLVACSFERRSMDAERDLAAAQRRIADADAELADRNREHAIDRDTAVRHAREDAQLARQERDLAQRRIAEMEVELRWRTQSHNEEAKYSCDLRSALRATYPVYRAAERWKFDALPPWSLAKAIADARAAMTPEILSVLAGLAGLEKISRPRDPVVGDSVERVRLTGLRAKIGIVTEVLGSSLLPFVVCWQDGGIVAYRADELRVLTGLENL